MKLVVLAIGGNALATAAVPLSPEDQFARMLPFADCVADMVGLGWNVLLTHGNGPQVGWALEREHGDSAPGLAQAAAAVQGSLGWLLTRALRSQFVRHSIERDVVALVTQTLVRRNDPAFGAPSKPIGSPMSADQAAQRQARDRWSVRAEASGSWRRVVASPRPLAIVELESIRALVGRGTVVIACGGGGIPVVEEADGILRGVEAVIDKDATSALLATALGAQALGLVTSVPGVALDFGLPTQRWLGRLTPSQARDYASGGRLETGSMAPKVRALADFADTGGALGFITDRSRVLDALRGQAGTCVFRDGPAAAA